MTKKKSSINWYFLIAGVLILYFGLSHNKEARQNFELRSVTVQLSKDIINVKRRTSPIDYKFWTKEYKNQFNILDGSITRGKHETIANLKEGQVIEVFITESDFNLLRESNKDIAIKGMSINGNYLMSETEFHKNRSLYKLRRVIFSVFIGIMVLLNGLISVPKKLNYAVVGIFVGVLLIIRILEIGIY